MRLATRIDSEQSAAGDPLEATLVHPVRDARGGTIPARSVIRGHLAQLEKVYSPRRRIIVAMRFDSIVLAGTPVPLQLSPVGQMDQRGRAVYVFAGTKLVLDKRFISRWRVEP